MYIYCEEQEWLGEIFLIYISFENSEFKPA